MRSDFFSGFLVRGHAPRAKSAHDIKKQYKPSLRNLLGMHGASAPDLRLTPTKLFFLLTPSRMEYYLGDPRPRFKQPIMGSFAFDAQSEVFACSDVWPGLPPHSFCISTDGQNLVLSAASHGELTEWLEHIRWTLDHFSTLVRGVLLKKSDKYPMKPWTQRIVELGETCLSYVDAQPGAKNVRNHIRLTGHASVSDLPATKQYNHVFGITTAHTTLVFSALSAEAKEHWMAEIEIRILRHKVVLHRLAKASDLEGSLTLRSAAGGRWQRRYCTLHNGLISIKAHEKRMGTKGVVPLEAILKIEPDTPSHRPHSFTIHRFGAPDLHVAACSATELSSWMRHLELARAEIQGAPSTVFADDIAALVKATGYTVVSVQPHERVELVLEQWHQRIFACNSEGRVTRGSVLVYLKSPGGNHDNFDIMWHCLRTQSRPVTMVFRLPIAKTGMLRLHTQHPVAQWVPRMMYVAEGQLTATALTSDNSAGAELFTWALRDCNVALVHDGNSALAEEMPNCFSIQHRERTTVLCSAATSEDCVLWMAVLLLEIAVARGDPALAPTKPSRRERRRHSLVGHARALVERLHRPDAPEGPETPATEVDAPSEEVEVVEEDSQSWRDRSDSDDDDDRGVADRLRHALGAARASCVAFVAEAAAAQKKALRTQRDAVVAHAKVQELLARTEKVRDRVKPLATAVLQRSRRLSADCSRSLDEIRAALSVPDPATHPLFDGTKRYLTAVMRGSSVAAIEARAAKKMQRFRDSQAIVEQFGALPPVVAMEANATPATPATLGVESARCFFDEVARGKETYPAPLMVQLLRRLAGTGGPCDAFEDAIDHLENTHALAYSIPKALFVEVALATVRDNGLVERIERFSRGHMLWIISS
ncbi:hypothetical protein ACHHYP_02001 [Achlya hypogyna]|uniref:PH domain-containing protein n=1 Tax=Achlya hypogyna TaxID=1202772 RepID=A0A1V9Z7I9_ACHHY|nr:hypothetical protein ACHHYP_02001 [Achlya hypogyna]